MSLPPLTEIEDANWDHLTTNAAAWTALASTWESAFIDIRDAASSPGGTPWTGAAAQGFQHRTATDVIKVHGPSDMLRKAADIATRGAQAQQSNKALVLSAVDTAEREDFRVNDDYTVTDSWTHYTSAAEQEARQQAAERHFSFIKSRAHNLVNNEDQIARDLTTTTTGLHEFRFAEDGADGGAGGNGQPQKATLVDHEFKQSPQPHSEARGKAVEYADRWAGSEDDPHRHNPDYADFGDGGGDCTNFASQTMRAGGFKDVGNGLDDWHRGDADDWYYNNYAPHWWPNDRSNTWSVAQDNYDFVTQSGRGESVGTASMPTSKAALDPLAPSKAGLQPGDLIYYRDPNGAINHTAVYVGQKTENGHLVDVVDQHALGNNNFRNDWMPDTSGFYGGQAQAEFVHLRYPGE